MKIQKFAAVGAVGLFLSLNTWGTASRATSPACPEQVSVEATIAPVAGQEGTFRLRVLSKDLKTGELLPSPQVFFSKGKGGAATASLPGEGEMEWTVSVEGSKAAYNMQVRCRGEVISSQKIAFELPSAGGAS